MSSQSKLISSRSKAIVMGLLVGSLGVVANILPFGLDLEENYGLQWLFDYRDVRPPPSDVVIVSLDKESAGRLGIEPADPAKWPRSYHADLVSSLKNMGAAVIVFDMIFRSDSPIREEDEMFGEAIRNAGNVVIASQLERENIANEEKRSAYLVESVLYPPIPVLADAAFAVGPFLLLTEVAEKVAQYWVVNREAGDTPCLPTLAFQVFTLDVYDAFLKLLKQVASSDEAVLSQMENLPPDRDTIIHAGGIENLVRDLASIFSRAPHIADEMLEQIAGAEATSPERRSHRLLESLIRMYQGRNDPYLNYYGPTGTIATIPYYRLLRNQETAPGIESIALRGKAVFVGAARMQQLKQDEFPFAFSEEGGKDIQGVEAAATAFANLLENMPIRWLEPVDHLIVILVWAILLALPGIRLPARYTSACTVVLSILYLVYIARQFGEFGVFYPVVIPLFIQAPLFLIGIFLWEKRDTSRQRQDLERRSQKLETVLRQHIPADEVESALNIEHQRPDGETTYGTCLFTDVVGSVELFEDWNPRQIRAFANRFCDTIFRPVIQDHSGSIGEFHPDEIVSYWPASEPDESLRREACLAALDISHKVRLRNASLPYRMEIRIGMYAGEMEWGDVGAYDLLVNRPTGRLVHRAKRLEDLNKKLGTRILYSAEVLSDLLDFQTRELGRFWLREVKEPIAAYELVCLKEESTKQQERLCSLFARAVRAYQMPSFDEAIEGFDEYRRICLEDVQRCNDCEEKDKRCLALLYLNLCKHYRADPPSGSWDGVVPPVD